MVSTGKILHDEATLHFARRISTVERLKLVITMGQEPDRVWSGLDLAVRTGIQGEDLRGHLQKLVDEGILEAGAGGACVAPTSEVRVLVAALASVYRDSPEAVLRAMNVAAIGRVREAAARLSEPPHRSPEALEPGGTDRPARS